jgi:hypothetical protein
MQNEKERYVVVTATSTFRQRYCIPISELQKLNTDVVLDEKMAIVWAGDSVVMEEVNEFSQKWLGETIVDTMVLDEKQTLDLFNSDNDYLTTWSNEEKIEFLNNWKINKVNV